jgi:ribosomal protein S18 acetylase RimI-like enzyme
MWTIVPLGHRHVSQVADLHLHHLQTNFNGLPGLKLLCSYYTSVVEGVGACGYVAEEDRRVLGYVCGVWSPSTIHRTMLKRSWFRLLFWGSAQLVIRPLLIGTYIDRFRQSPSAQNTINSGFELRPIVVVPSMRGTGVASDLVATLLAAAARQGFQHVHLFTETDNLAANAFYRKTGFLSMGATHSSSIGYVRYERSTSWETV